MIVCLIYSSLFNLLLYLFSYLNNLQFFQAVVSPVSSNNSTFDTVSNDNFSIDGEFDGNMM